MKRFTICLTGALLVLSLAACTPTPEKQAAAGEESMEERSTGGVNDKVPDPNVEPMAIVSVYSANEDGSGLNQAMDAVDELTAAALVDKLAEYGMLEEGTEVLTFESTSGTAVLDLSKIPEKSGKEKELLLISIGNTFTENFELDQLKLLVNGKAYSGGDKLEFTRDYK